jgi:hypothetical protein
MTGKDGVPSDCYTEAWIGRSQSSGATSAVRFPGTGCARLGKTVELPAKAGADGSGGGGSSETASDAA